jgi:lipopolysaccharide/colanic/teichoic acid biosynthesis glycosyltransferase
MAAVSSPFQNAISIDPGYLKAKRTIDVLFTLLVLLPFCIIVVIVAILIRLDSDGPIFFRQKRVGLKGVEFKMYKFRSMHVYADDLSHRKATKEYMNGATLNGKTDQNNLYKLEDDPRVTRIGRFLRKTSIDELPQFINVLRGEMTLVGPRPPLSYEVEEYSPHDWIRLSGRPGLTGRWQVYGRSRVPFKTMVEMDLEYLEQQSLVEDLKLIAKTLPVMLLGRGGV